MALVLTALPETLLPPRRVRLTAGGIASRYLGVLRERNFFVHATVNSCAMFGMFAYIGGSPPVYIEWFGLGPAAYGTAFGLAAGCYILGSQINPRILHRFGAPFVLRAGVRGYLLSSLVLAAFAFGGRFGVVSVFVPVAAGMFCMGFVMPNAAVGALSRHSAHAGSASALMGTMQFILAAVSGTAVGWLTDGSPRPMAALMVAGSLCAVVVELFRLKPKKDSPS
jgi:DHA1 family bicyclomycin/chloramphenicol resistance-like MFS transporter